MRLIILLLAFLSMAATYNVVMTKNATLVLLTVDTVNFSFTPCSWIDIFNVGPTDIFARVDGTNPSASGDDSFRAPAGLFRRLANPNPYAPQARLLSTAASTYSVECGN